MSAGAAGSTPYRLRSGRKLDTLISREFRYDVELRTSGRRSRTFRYAALVRPGRGPKLLRYHSDWFIAEAIDDPVSETSLGTIVGVEVTDLMRNDMRDVVADCEDWDAATRSLATDRTRMLRRDALVRWLLVLHEPPSLRAVRDDGTVIGETQIEMNVDQPVHRALLAISDDAPDTQ
jgi:hypothetical protein